VRTSFTLTNLSTRPLRVRLFANTLDEGAAAVDFRVRPTRVRLFRGRSVTVHVSAITSSAPNGSTPTDGAIVARVEGGGGIRIPWAIAFGPADVNLLQAAKLSARSFAASDTKPALLSLDAGRVLVVDGRIELRPVSRLDVQLWRANGTEVGTLARLRDVLPGRYTFGLTGRDPNGGTLPAGAYEIRVVAYPVDSGRASRRKLAFTLK
jgi:hypothetical protein